MPQGKKKKAPASKPVSNASLSAVSGPKIHSLEAIVSQATRSNCTADTLAVVLNHLKPELLPDSGDLPDNLYPDDAENVRCASLALALLAKVIEACHRDSDLNEIIVDKLTEFIDTLCLWIEVLVGLGLCYPASTLCGVCARSHAHHTYSHLLLDLQSLDERFEQALFTSHSFFHILIVLWMMEDGEEGHRIGHALEHQPTPVRPPVVSLLLSFLLDDGGKAELFRHASMSPRKFGHDFVALLRQRACKVRDTLVDKVDPVDVASFFEDVMYIIEHLAENDVFRRELSSSSYLIGFALILDTVSMAMKLRAPKHHYLLLDAAHQLSTIADDVRPYHAAKNWCNLIEGGFWALSVRLLGSVPQGDHYYRKLGLECLTRLGRQTAYRPVVSTMLAVLLPAEALRGINGRLEETMSRWMQAVEYRKEALRNVKTNLTLCDNPDCSPSSASRRASLKPKKCSKCRSMVYCSESCQKEDWDKLHRSECSALKEMSIARERSETMYHHSTRAFQVAVVEQMYNKLIGEAERLKASPPTTKPLRERILAIDAVSFVEKRGFADLNEWEVVHAHTPEYLKPRLWPLIQSYRSSANTDTVRLAEGLFPLGEELVDLIVVLRRKGKRWEAVYSVSVYEDAGDADYPGDSEIDEGGAKDGDEEEDESSTDGGSSEYDSDDDSEGDADGGSDDDLEDQ